MYTNGLLSLGNINQLAKGGMMTKNKQNDKKEGGGLGDFFKNMGDNLAKVVPIPAAPGAPAAGVISPSTPPTPGAPVAGVTSPSTPGAAAPASPGATQPAAGAGAPATPVSPAEGESKQVAPTVSTPGVSTPGVSTPGVPGPPTANAETPEESIFSRIKNMIGEILVDYQGQSEKIIEQTPNIYIVLFAVFVISIVIATQNAVFYLLKRMKTYKIIAEDRYNKDLVEYNMAKNPKMFGNLQLATYTALAFIPFLLLIITIVIGVRFISKSPDNKLTTILLFISLTIIFAIIVILSYFIKYISVIKELKRTRARIDLFENFVYSNFYLNNTLLQTLYNNGNSTDNPNAIIRKAIKNTLLENNANLDIATITKIAYTFNIYYFLNKDLVNDEELKRYYKTESLELFNPRLVMLPGKSKIFRIGDYMRSNIPANMTETGSISNILNAMNVILKLDNNKLNLIKIEVKNNMYKTQSLAFQISAYKMDKQILTLVIISIIMYILLATIIAIMLYKATKETKETTTIETE